MAVINIMESIIEGAFAEFVKNYSMKCGCQKCKEDILAITLNRIPPKYVSSHRGEVFVKSQYMEHQLQMDIMRELARALLIVEKNPNHEAHFSS